MEGLLPIGTDVLHQSLQLDLAGVQRVSPRFRHGEHWAELVRHSLLIGTIMGSFCLEKLLLSGQAPHWDGLAALPLEQQPAACQEPAAWINRARDRKLAIPIYTDLLRTAWIAAHGPDRPATPDRAAVVAAAAGGVEHQGSNNAGSASKPVMIAGSGLRIGCPVLQLAAR